MTRSKTWNIVLHPIISSVVSDVTVNGKYYIQGVTTSTLRPDVRVNDQ